MLAVVTPMVSRVAKLDNYTRRTGRLQPAALAVREALASAVEPDELLFVTLPEALGFDPVTADTPACGYAAQFATAVAAALDELSACLDGLLDELLVLLLDSAGASRTGAVVGQAAMLGDEVLDPEVRAFVLALANDGCDSDAAWISAVATVVARRAPAEWNDDDRTRFCRELPPRLAAFHRLVALHAERRADGGGPFDALRVTVTRPDGVEHIRLVGVDARHRGELEQTLDGALDRLVPIAGSSQRAQHGLLGLLAERLLEEREADARLLPAVAASRAPHDSDPDHATSSRDDPPAVPNGATPDSGSSHAGPAAGDPAHVPGRGGLGVAARAVGDG